MEVTHRLRPPDETNGTDSYTDSYTYGPTGDRATATYATPAATMRWKYGDYVPIGDPLKDQRAFQTLTLLDSSGNPTAEEMHYSYDQLGRLQNAAFAQTPASGYTPPTGGDWYGTNPSMHLANVRARAFYTYDPGGRMLSVYHWWDTYAGSGAYSSTPILGNSCSYEYTGSKRGLKTGATYWTNSSGSFADAWDETYGYDSNFDYLTSFTTTDGQANASQSWAYDPAGNRTSDYTGSSWAYDNLNRMTANGVGTSCSNDVLGNRTAFGSSVSYSWDCLNRMTGYTSGAGTYAYVYRGDGMRVSKSTSGTSTLYRYDSQTGIEDVDTTSSGTTITHYGLGGRGIDFASATTSGGISVTFPIYDTHGNEVATLSRTGSTYAIGNSRDFDPWGLIRGGWTTGDPKGRYSASLGHKQDDESGLTYMRARYYDATSGRFLSQDSHRSGLNWLVYANSQPVSMEDVNGKDFDRVHIGRDPQFGQKLMDLLVDYIAGDMDRDELAQSIEDAWMADANFYKAGSPASMNGSWQMAITVADDFESNWETGFDFGSGLSLPGGDGLYQLIGTYATGMGIDLGGDVAEATEFGEMGGEEGGG